MSVDLVADVVAGYAAVVATAGVGWQVYQWRSDQRERQGELTVRIVSVGRRVDAAAGNAAAETFVEAQVINDNDYCVRISSSSFTLAPPSPGDPDSFYVGVGVHPEDLGLPGELAGHHGARFEVGKNILPQLSTLRTGSGRLTLTVGTTVGREFTDSAVISLELFAPTPPTQLPADSEQS